MNEIIKKLPKMESGNELIDKLTMLPEYNEDIRLENEAIRLMSLEDIYKIYIPSNMTKEIYSKLYLSMLRSLQKKNTKLSIKQQNENYKRIMGNDSLGIIGGSDSFTIFGTSGIGKSSAIMRSINLATDNRIIEIENPYQKVIPVLLVQCPFDCSIKGLLFEILRKVDEILGSDFYKSYIKVTATTDMLIGCVSQVALNHIGLLIVDEIQNVLAHKNGQNLVSCLTQLINNSGISICMVGTPESEAFFEKVDYLARRALGLKYCTSSYDEYFKAFCEIVFSYQYVKNKTKITDAHIEWLYEHSAGVVSNVITLIHDAQEIAILTGSEILDFCSLEEAYKQRMSTMHTFIRPHIITNNRSPRRIKKGYELPKNTSTCNETEFSISNIAKRAKREDLDVVELLREKITIEVISA